MPPREGLPDSIIAVWGKLELEQLNATDVAILASGESPHKGILVSFLGDLHRSAKLGAPIYRLAGRAGYLWVATFNQDGRGVLRFLTIDASQIAPAGSSAQVINLPDQALCVNALNRERSAWDQSSIFSKDVAEAARRGLTVNACRQLIGGQPSLAAEATNAATISVTFPFSDDPDRALVTVFGQIAFNDHEKFQRKVSSLSPKTVVAFQSDGGSAVAAIEIGKLIRLRNFYTVVPDNVRCASACALAWLGGTIRFMGANSQIGFHAVSIRGTGQETGAGNALVGHYLSQIGLAEVAALYITHEGPRSMTWLSLADAIKAGIDVAVLDAPGSSGPSEPTKPVQSDIASLHQRSKQFITALYDILSGPEEKITPTLNNVYADPVRYFGKETSRKDIVTQEERFRARWPMQHYEPKEETVTIDCDANALTCTVKGVLEFDAQSPVRNQHSTGEATFEYFLRFSPSQQMPTIEVEDGKTLKRNIHPLSNKYFINRLQKK